MSEEKNVTAAPEAEQAQDVNELRQIRIEKLEALQAAGKDPFTITTAEQSISCAEIAERFAELEPQKSHATAIAVIFPLTVVSLAAYTKSVTLNTASFWYIVSGGVAGSVIGAKLLKKISSGLLKKIFGIFILVAAFRMVTK